MKNSKNFHTLTRGDLLNSKKGITLIALIITIIVLLILAGVSLALVLGDNGVVNKASKAKSQTVIGSVKDAAEIIRGEYSVNNNGNDPTSRYIIEKLIQEGKILSNQVENYGDENGIGVIVVEGQQIQIKGKNIINGIYSAIYNDGTLVFANSMNDIDLSKVIENYEIRDIYDEAYYWNYDEVSRQESYIFPEWINYDPENEDINECGNTFITKIKVLSEIYPKNTAWWFYGLVNVTEVDLRNMNTIQDTDMSNMFARCESLLSLDISNFDTRNVVNMEAMFDRCRSLTTIDLSNFNTNNVTNMCFMFATCDKLANINVSSFNTANVTNMRWMFAQNPELVNLDLSSFNTSNVTNMEAMFTQCYKLKNLNISSFNTGNVVNMDYMFGNGESLEVLDLSSFDTRNVQIFTDFLGGCGNLQTIYASDSFVTTSVVRSDGMFGSCNSLVGGNGTAYASTEFDDEITYARIDTPDTPGFFTSKDL